MAFPSNPNPGDSYTDAYGTVWIYAGTVNGWYRQTVTTPNDTSYTAAISGPAGSNTQVQFNDNGELAGDSGLTYNKTTDALSGGAFIPTGSTVPSNGLYRPSANNVALSTNGTGRLFVDASGNVGVGTVPGTSLHIQGANTTGKGQLIVSSASAGQEARMTFVDGSDDIAEISTNGNDFYFLNETATGAFQWYTGGSERLRITSAGLVGIGTSSPNQALEVVGSQWLRGAYSTNTALAFVGNSGTGRDFAVVRSAAATMSLEMSGRNAFNIVGNTGDTNCYFTFSGTGSTEHMRLDSSGRLGVGTTNPGALLEVLGADTAIGSNGTILVKSDSGGADDGGQITLGSTNGRHVAIAGRSEGGSGTAGYLQLGVRGSSGDIVERARIDSSGRVGIGTQSPIRLFHALDSANSIVGRVESGQSSSWLQFAASGTGTASRIGDPGGSVKAGLAFMTADTERARIDSSGRLLVGTSTSLNSNSLLQVHAASGSLISRTSVTTLENTEVAIYRATSGSRNADLGVYKHSGITNPGPYMNLMRENGNNTFYWTDNSNNFRISGSIDHIGTTSGTVVGTQTSDERLKNILGPVEYGLETIKQIEPVRYALKDEPGAEKLGFIAQQVQPLVPQSVFDTNEHIEGEPENAPTKLGMEYVALIPVLVNAIKELSAEVDALKAQLS